MKRVEGGCTVHSLEDFLRDTSTQWVRKKVCCPTLGRSLISTSSRGWAPSTFVSSRSDRTNKKTARPEDFMDEEDLAELRDNQKLVGSTDEMDLDFWSRNGKAEGTGEQEYALHLVLL